MDLVDRIIHIKSSKWQRVPCFPYYLLLHRRLRLLRHRRLSLHIPRLLTYRRLLRPDSMLPLHSIGLFSNLHSSSSRWQVPEDLFPLMEMVALITMYQLNDLIITTTGKQLRSSTAMLMDLSHSSTRMLDRQR